MYFRDLGSCGVWVVVFNACIFGLLLFTWLGLGTRINFQILAWYFGVSGSSGFRGLWNFELVWVFDFRFLEWVYCWLPVA